MTEDRFKRYHSEEIQARIKEENLLLGMDGFNEEDRINFIMNVIEQNDREMVRHRKMMKRFKSLPQ
ncbi:hypothetical protein [Burkholderia vietnamiensis]|uniref:hypothetical protein n=1 Tax=Burkholderia vietnamiensis TaxID=60552 RepID=UPI000B2BE398|nr:hypothetical protein [Burkholderia vietnamiensis]HDR8931758.1 hypothetical protein [Burkholderia vietnamiensis]